MGDCHYDAGNYKFDRRMRLVYRLLDELGLEKERVQHDWISASEGEKFANTIRRVTAEIQELGPSPLKEQDVYKRQQT